MSGPSEFGFPACSICSTSPSVPAGWFIAPDEAEYPGMADAYWDDLPVMRCSCNPGASQ